VITLTGMGLVICDMTIASFFGLDLLNRLRTLSSRFETAPRRGNPHNEPSCH